MKIIHLVNKIVPIFACSATLVTFGVFLLERSSISSLMKLNLWQILIIFLFLSLLLWMASNKVEILKNLFSALNEYLIKPLLFSPFYLLFGGIARRRILMDIHRTSTALQESALFGRLAGLRNPAITNYHIIFTHKKNHAEIGNLENYRMPGFPFDEAQTIMRLWYFVTSNLYIDWTKVTPVCSCVKTECGDKEKVCKGSLSIVGSPKGNQICEEFMEKLSQMDKSHKWERTHKLIMKHDGGEGASCYVEEITNPDDPYKPSLFNINDPPSPDRVLKDYGLIIKVPNLFMDVGENNGHCILLLAGCKVGGQCGINEWFFAPENLSRLAVDYAAEYFQIFLEINYKFVPKGNPKIVSVNIIKEEKISYKN